MSEGACSCGSIFIRSICYNCGNVRESNDPIIPVTDFQEKPKSQFKVKKTATLKAQKNKAYRDRRRDALFERDGWACLKCGFKGTPKNNRRRNGKWLTIDHILPKSKGGRNTWENQQTLCNECNGEKANKYHDYRKH